MNERVSCFAIKRSTNPELYQVGPQIFNLLKTLFLGFSDIAVYGEERGCWGQEAYCIGIKIKNPPTADQAGEGENENS